MSSEQIWTGSRRSPALSAHHTARRRAGQRYVVIRYCNYELFAGVDLSSPPAGMLLCLILLFLSSTQHPTATTPPPPHTPTSHHAHLLPVRLKHWTDCGRLQTLIQFWEKSAASEEFLHTTHTHTLCPQCSASHVFLNSFIIAAVCQCCYGYTSSISITKSSTQQLCTAAERYRDGLI